MALDELKEFCTDRQFEYLSAWEKHGSARAAARALGVSPSVISRARIAVEKKAARQGVGSTFTNQKTAPGYSVKGVSTFYGPDGEVRGEWVKKYLENDTAVDLAKRAAEDCADMPRVKPIRGPENTQDVLCNVYTLTDCHIGMLAWHREGGENWDLKRAEETLTNAFSHMIQSAPKAETAIVNQLGDYLHYDGLEPVTPTSGFSLDSDDRFEKIVRVAVRVLRNVIDMSLATHKRVHVKNAEGNHDIVSSIWLRQMLAAIYENEPRITVDTSPLPHYVYRHGRTMLAFHHGHLKKKASLPAMMAAQFPEMFGETKFRYLHVGHLHHRHEIEENGWLLIQHPTLAARDAYAARHGFIALRSAVAMTYHNEYGEVARTTVTPEMLL